MSIWSLAKWVTTIHRGKIMYFKVITLGAIIAAGFAFADVPVHDPWFWVTIYLLVYRNLVVSLIEGMPEPTDKSSDSYVWTYRSLHTMDRRFSPYRLHKTFWPLFENKKSGE